MIAMVIGRLSADRFITRFGAISTLHFSGYLILGGFATIFFSHWMGFILLGFIMVGIGMASGVPICFSLAGHLDHISPSAAIAMVTAISFWGFMVSPPAIGFFSQLFNLRIAFSAMMFMGISIIAIAPKLATSR
jgi:MFS family permease